MTPDQKHLMQYAFLAGAVAARENPVDENFLGPRAFERFLSESVSHVKDARLRSILDEAPVEINDLYSVTAENVDEDNTYERIVSAQSPEGASLAFHVWLEEACAASGNFRVTMHKIPRVSDVSSGVVSFEFVDSWSVDFDDEENLPEVA